MHDLYSEIDKLYQDYASKNHIPGYCYAIIVGDKLAHLACAGYANLDKKTTVTKNTVFRIASMTKSFTAMAILKLRDARKLNLDDPVSLYLPAIRVQKPTLDSPEITIRDLLNHTAGFPQDDPWADRRLDATVEELENVIAKGVMFSTPSGTKFEYSNLGYTILGYIINKVSGISYQEYIATNIWQPLGMDQATWEYSSVPEQNLAQGYRSVEDKWQPEELLHDGIYGAMGGIMVSIADFSKYASLHINAWPSRDDPENGPVNRSTIRSMHRPWILYDKQAGYGFGFRWFCDDKFIKYVTHSGGVPGFGSNWTMLPDYGIAVIAMTNLTYMKMNDLNAQVLNILLEAGLAQPREITVRRRKLFIEG